LPALERLHDLHYWGKGPAQKLATAFRTAVDQTGARPKTTTAQR